MTKEGKIIIGLLVAMSLGGAVAYNELDGRVQQAGNQASGCHCPQTVCNRGNDPNCAGAMETAGRYGIASAASHSYFERLLEGLVRHAGLPLERARSQFDKSGTRPAGWRWLKPWEGTKTPATPPRAAPPPKRP